MQIKYEVRRECEDRWIYLLHTRNLRSYSIDDLTGNISL